MIRTSLALLVLLFAVPPVLTIAGFATGDLLAGAIAAAAWALLTTLYVPTIRYFCLSPAWTLTLPLAGFLYGAMTVDSAVRDRRHAW